MSDFDTAWPGALSGPSHLLQPWEEDQQPRPLVVFFGAKDLLEEQFNFPSLGRGLPAHRLFLNNGANAWYQGGIPGFAQDFEACSSLISAWAKALNANEICCVGTSMGAYGAMLHGARLGARVLAFSVDHLIEAPGSQSEQHYDGPKPAPYPDLADAIAAAASGFSATVIAGERDAADLYSALKLAAANEVSACSVVGADHFVPSCLTRRGHLNRLLHRFAKGGDLDLPMQGRALEHPEYVELIHASQSALDAGAHSQAKDLADQASKLFPDGEAACLITARALQKLDLHEDAINAFSRALVLTPNEVSTLSLLAQSMRQADRLVSARAVHDYILTLAPGRHPSHYALALISQKEGKPAQALAELRRALQSAPGNKTYRDRLKIIQAAIAASEP